MVMRSVQVRFPQETLERIDGLVEAGEYPSRSEYVRDAVRQVEMMRALRELGDLLDAEGIDLHELLDAGGEVRRELYEAWLGAV